MLVATYNRLDWGQAEDRVSTRPGENPSGADLDKVGQDEIEGRTASTDTSSETPPTPGTHAESALTNHEATPGSGALPSAEPHDEADAATG
jgi:hypothetical protein